FLYPSGFIATAVARLHDLPSIVSIRGNDVGKYAFDPLRRPFVRAALEQADQVTSVATSLTCFADRMLAPIAHKSRTILNSVEIDPDLPRDRPEVATQGLVIGSAGLFRYKKGLIYLLKALAADPALRARVGEGARRTARTLTLAREREEWAAVYRALPGRCTR